MDRLERQIAITKRANETVKQTYALRHRRFADQIRKLKAEIATKKDMLNIQKQD